MAVRSYFAVSSARSRAQRPSAQLRRCASPGRKPSGMLTHGLSAALSMTHTLRPPSQTRSAIMSLSHPSSRSPVSPRTSRQTPAARLTLRNTYPSPSRKHCQGGQKMSAVPRRSRSSRCRRAHPAKCRRSALAAAAVQNIIAAQSNMQRIYRKICLLIPFAVCFFLSYYSFIKLIIQVESLVYYNKRLILINYHAG